MNTHWWQVLPAIPSANDTIAYRRLTRVWRDRTWFAREKEGNNRIHQFVNDSKELHMTVTLWENFVLFDPKIWLPKLFALAGLEWNFGEIEQLQWSYEWESRKPKKRIADIVVHSLDGGGEQVIVVIEAKRPNGENRAAEGLGAKDEDISTYLDAELLRNTTKHRFLLYLVDEIIRPTVTTETREDGCRSGVITWQQLGGLQIKLVGELDLPPTISAFIAGSIQQQYCAHDILPDRLAFDYLNSEPSMQQVDDDPQYKLLASGYGEPLWRIE